MLKKRQKAVCVSVAGVIVLAVLAWVIYGLTLCDIKDDSALAKRLAADKDCLPEIMAVDTDGDYAAVLYLDTAYGDRAASIRYFKKLKGMKKSTADDVIDEILLRLNLKDAGNKKIKALSGGMKQRVLFAESVLNNPKILILDEPTAGLDPRERINFRNMLAGLAENRIILLATHIVSDIECIADRVILLKGGVKIGEDTPEGLMESIAGKVFEVRGEREKLIELQKETGLGNIMHNQNGLTLRVVTDEPKEYYTPVKGSVSLEDVYLYYFEYLKSV